MNSKEQKLAIVRKQQRAAALKIDTEFYVKAYSIKDKAIKFEFAACGRRSEFSYGLYTTWALADDAVNKLAIKKKPEATTSYKQAVVRKQQRAAALKIDTDFLVKAYPVKNTTVTAYAVQGRQSNFCYGNYPLVTTANSEVFWLIHPASNKKQQQEFEVGQAVMQDGSKGHRTLHGMELSYCTTYIVEYVHCDDEFGTHYKLEDYSQLVSGISLRKATNG